MKEEKTIKLTGFFSVRQYKKGVPRNEQAILADDQQIAFIASIPFEPQPDEPAEITAARPYGSPYEIIKDDGTVIKKLRLKIKIGSKYCQWFEAMPDGTMRKHRPENTEMDGKKYQVVAKYTYKEKKSDDSLSASGMWANAIAFREVTQSAFDENPFGDEDFSNVPPVVNPAPTQAAMPETPEQSGNEKKDGDLPF